jgi:hypothetical protein
MSMLKKGLEREKKQLEKNEITIQHSQEAQDGFR